MFINKLYNKIKAEKQSRFSSLGRELILWILTLSLLPLIIISALSYMQNSSGFYISATEKLEQSSDLSVSFINNWFEYRILDLNNQAESNENISLLNSLVDGLRESEKSAGEYVKSYDWAKRVDGLQDNLVKLARRYDYIYDIFLIDSQGNIIFTVAHESDLGTNLKSGLYSKTLFAASVNKTFETGELSFSDIERYAPSNNTLAGFLTAPLLDEFGSKVGVLAIQLKLDRILNIVQRKLDVHTTLIHYLIGEDGRLRSSLKINRDQSDQSDQSEILTKI